MVKWTEVSAYSGMPVKEDAPTNFVAVAGTGDDSSVVVDEKEKEKNILRCKNKRIQRTSKEIRSLQDKEEKREKNASKINEEQIDEREKSRDPRQFLNPDKENDCKKG